MFNKFLLTAFAVLTLAACSSTGGNEVLTESGFKVDFHKDVEGQPLQVGDFVSFHYSVSNSTSEVFNSRDIGDTPQTVIPETTDPTLNTSGVLEALKLCSTGDSVTVYYPVDSMATPPSGFEGEPYIVYTIEVLETQDAASYEAEQLALQEEGQAAYLTAKTFLDGVLEQYKAGELDGQLKTLDSGLQIMIHEEGTGEKAQAGQTVFAHYLGVNKEDGSEFDTSFKRGSPLSFPLGRGQVIVGWDQGFAELNPGTKATLFIPSDLAYGERGSPPRIMPNSDLVFYVELVDVQ